MEKASKFETVAGSLPAQLGTTAIAAVYGGPAAALLPVLFGTLANKRHKKRVEIALEDIEKQIHALGDQFNNISDAQYKFFNESLITMLHSPDDKKIEYLKIGIKRSLAKDRLNLHEAGLVSRILRDITVEELCFLMECEGKKIVFHNNPKHGCLNIDKLSLDGERAIGLIGLGLLTKEQGEGMLSDEGIYVFTPISEKLVELIRD